MLSLKESLKIIKKYRIPIVESYFSLEIEYLKNRIKNFDKAVLKVYSPDIVHKTEAKSVILDIRNKKELEKAYKDLLCNVFSYNKNSRIESFVLQKQINGLEIFVGGKTDNVFGKVIVFGAGGIFTEIYKDISIRVLPIYLKDVEEMVKEIKVYEILKGFRGKKFNLKSLFELILRSGNMFLKENIKEFDFNPVIINEKGVYVVDWRFIR
ncbi:MAG: acetate--CoA ligase family protein [Candidatus Aenigmatarchaeota archaeon]